MKNSGKKMVSKMKIIVIVIIIIAAIITGALLIMKLTADRHILDGPGMINHRAWEVTGVSYGTHGGSDGASFSMSVETDQNGKLIYTYSDIPHAGAEETAYSCEISPQEFENIRQICISTECLIEDEGKPSEIQLLDAPVTTVTFTLTDGSAATFRSDYEYSPKCDGLFSMVYEVLESFKE